MGGGERASLIVFSLLGCPMRWTRTANRGHPRSLHTARARPYISKAATLEFGDGFRRAEKGNRSRGRMKNNGTEREVVMQRPHANIEKIRVQLAWVNEPVDSQRVS